MSYVITTESNNGYRCSCCRRTHEYTDFLDDRSDALAQCPTVPPDQEFDLESVVVRDGASGEVIAEGRLEWYGGRSEKYHVQRWTGHVEGVPFENIQGGQPGESWAEILTRRNREKAAEEIEKAERELQAAKDKLARLAKPKDEGADGTGAK